MKLFNAFQAVLMFVAWPFLVQWLNQQDFSGASAAFYGACALYVVGFVIMTVCVRHAMDSES